MLLKCSSCNLKYLINSADLKPNGRTVRCAMCGYEWFQEAKIIEEDILTSSIPGISLKEQNEKKEDLSFAPNLPSTYVVKKKPSIISSILVILFLLIILFIFWIIKREGIGIIVLLNYYIQEFYFNLLLIISDLAKIIYQIIN